MNCLSFFATIALAISIVEGFYILCRDFKSEANRLFFFICLSISIWLFGGAFGYSASTREDAFFWLKVTSPGFIFMHAFVLHFAIRYTDIIRSRLVYLLYLPSLIFLYISLSDHLVFSDIYRSGNYWVMVPDYRSASFYLFMFNYLSYYCMSLLLLYIKIKKTASARVRGQSRVIMAALVITIASYNLEPFLAPLLFNYNTYGQAPVYSIVWVSLIWYAMNKYRFLGVYEEYLPFDFIDSLGDMVVITDSDKKIVRINRVLEEKIEPSDTGLSLETIFVEHELMNRMLDSESEKSLSDIILNIKVPGDESRVARVSISIFRDRFGDTVGYIIAAREVFEAFSFLEKRGITKREYQLIQLVVAGNTNRQIADALNISLRTVETHITSIYSKLGLERRSELINFSAGLFAGTS